MLRKNKTQPTMQSATKSHLNTVPTGSVVQSSEDDWNKPRVEEEEEEEEEEDGLVNSFNDMNLKSDILSSIYNNGFENPSQCQRGIPLIIEHADRSFVVQAKTGTGKTACFVIATAQTIVRSIHNTQIVILAPSRELALQIYEKACELLTNTDITIALHRGTSSRDETIKTEGDKYLTNTKNSSHYGKEQMVIATPGRFLGMICKPTYVREGLRFQINTEYIQQIVCDEVDKLLDTSHDRNNSGRSGMSGDVHTIFDELPSYARRLYFSATLSNDVAIHVRNENAMLLTFAEEIDSKNTNRYYYVSLIEEEEKMICLQQIIEEIPNAGSTIVFASSIMMVSTLLAFMKHEGFPVAALHSRMSQAARDRVIKGFRRGDFRILISTDVAARGIDIITVDLVFNYNLPTDENISEFMHRSGRSGRFGRVGTSISFVVESTNAKPADIVKIEKTFAIEIIHLPKLDSIFK